MAAAIPMAAATTELGPRLLPAALAVVVAGEAAGWVPVATTLVEVPEAAGELGEEAVVLVAVVLVVFWAMDVAERATTKAMEAMMVVNFIF